MTADADNAREHLAEGRPSLSQAARRERLAELASALGDQAVVEGDKLIVETGDPIALYARVEPDGSFALTWWRTASSPTGHPRWGEAAARITRPNETIHTSALGGGFLVEVERRAATIEEAVALAGDRTPYDRVRELVAAYPEALSKLPAEDVPDYLLPNRDLS